jgi:hypothetical protein
MPFRLGTWALPPMKPRPIIPHPTFLIFFFFFRSSLPGSWKKVALSLYVIGLSGDIGPSEG